MFSERPGHADMGINAGYLYSHVFPGLHEAAAVKFDGIFEVGEDENSDANVGKVLTNSEDLASRPYRIRTCDTLIKRYKRYVPERKKK
jgi:hypothetical protein